MSSPSFSKKMQQAEKLLMIELILHFVCLGELNDRKAYMKLKSYWGTKCDSLFFL